MFFNAASRMRLCALATCAVIVLSACSSKNNSAAPASGTSGTTPGAGGKPKSIVAEAYVVKPVSYAPTYTASGELMANESVDIHPEVSGRVTQILFREGATVRKGQLLLQVNDADIRAQVAKLQAQRALQQSTLRRSEELVKIGGISRADYDAARTGVQGINADITATQATLAKLQIRAPFDGTIGLRGISPGAIISPTTVIASLQQLSPLKMEFTIPDEYRAQLRLGQEIRFYVDGRTDTLRGKISAIDPGADPMTHTVRARAIVPNTDRAIFPGAFAHVLIAFGQASNTILIPSQSIIPTTRDKKVALLRGGKAVMQVVKTGERTEDRVQIIQGLQMGDTVLTTALMQVKQGMEIKARIRE